MSRFTQLRYDSHTSLPLAAMPGGGMFFRVARSLRRSLTSLAAGWLFFGISLRGGAWYFYKLISHFRRFWGQRGR